MLKIVTLLTKDNVQLMEQLESDLKETTNWNNFFYQFKDRRVQETYNQYFPPTVEIKDCNIVIDGRNFFHQPVKNNLRTYNKIRRIAIKSIT